ncbi:hypothetical protein [Poriferisphaera sp. WC338]|uniref:hypothetical protein n=1 Tax=Poriferisphaera sp. WC338 TaxID=3425129 RepID=UPI003D814758
MASVMIQKQDQSLVESATDGVRVVDGEVITDLECLECGYNLRTMRVWGQCPECGMKVGVSLRNDRLCDASPAWLSTVYRGTRIMRAGVILSFPFLYVGVVLGTVGFFHVLQKETGRQEPRKDRYLRLMSQGLLGAGAMGLIGVMMGLVWMVVMKRWRMFEDVLHFDWMVIVAHAVYFLGVIHAWMYVGVLAERLPDEGLVKRCQRVRWDWFIAIGGIVLIAAMADVGSVMYEWFGHYNKYYGPALVGCVGLVLLWLWWRTVRFCGVVIERMCVIAKVDL